MDVEKRLGSQANYTAKVSNLGYHRMWQVGPLAVPVKALSFLQHIPM